MELKLINVNDSWCDENDHIILYLKLESRCHYLSICDKNNSGKGMGSTLVQLNCEQI